MQKIKERKIRENQIYQKNHKAYWCVKRMLDIIFSLMVVIGLLPLFLLISIAIFIDDPHGSPIFKQTRVGRHGKRFKMYKFRTMVVGADKMVMDLADQNEKDGPVFKIKKDPRVTQVGRFLRKTSLDELPQFFNVILGDMTIVGPRPPLVQEVEKYGDYEMLRLSVTPGLTCDWQTKKKRDDIPFDEWMDMDIDYIGKRSIIKDIKLIIKTVETVIRGNGT